MIGELVGRMESGFFAWARRQGEPWVKIAWYFDERWPGATASRYYATAGAGSW